MRLTPARTVVLTALAATLAALGACGSSSGPTGLKAPPLTGPAIGLKAPPLTGPALKAPPLT